MAELTTVLLESTIIIALAGLGTAYAIGWRRWRVLGPGVPAWRVAAYVLGLASIAIALLSPIDRAAAERFSAHMVQHLILTMVAAPLLLLGDPFPVVLWSASLPVRMAVGAPFRPGGTGRSILALLTALPTAWLLSTGVLWIWHWPALYETALEHDVVHAVEHVTFFLTAVLFWWPIVRPAPHVRPRPHPGLQILYLIAATAQSVALGALLSIPERVLYPYYGARAASLGVNALDDQLLGGGLMWGSGHMYLVPILVILYRFARQDA
jgi:putative membrane protein